MNGDKTMKQLQQEVDEYIGQFKEGYFQPMEMMARLTEELGELSREVMHQYGPKKKKSSETENSIEEEMGDLLFVLICMANSMDINLADAHDRVIDKFNTRDQNRWTRKDEQQ
ncbi:nucleotide pyrophosphohydrolase [Planococcus donghaensis]|uniref:Nucleotide pyrophosphohydrolase n=1 Tax=Planococcus donghaensis TaxID=414778 RepID=A0A1C7EGW8_9BACL|nr:nucleotide pyrophosphohydrolase [Planococcus donghaensis]ANU23018.1 nucleotide pyrophosphohydrolase [Planococcus donghaensis]